MNYQEKFEDEGFVYALIVEPWANEEERCFPVHRGNGYYCQWIIKEKQKDLMREIAVTDDNCNIVVYTSIEAAVRGARDFLSL